MLSERTGNKIHSWKINYIKMKCRCFWGMLNPWICKIQGSGRKKKTCILQMYLLADYYQNSIPTKLNVSSLVNCLTWFVLQEPQSWQHLSKYELYLKLSKPDLPPWEKYALSYYFFNLWLWNMALNVSLYWKAVRYEYKY